MQVCNLKNDHEKAVETAKVEAKDSPKRSDASEKEVKKSPSKDISSSEKDIKQPQAVKAESTKPVMKPVDRKPPEVTENKNIFEIQGVTIEAIDDDPVPVVKKQEPNTDTTTGSNNNDIPPRPEAKTALPLAQTISKTDPAPGLATDTIFILFGFQFDFIKGQILYLGCIA